MLAYIYCTVYRKNGRKTVVCVCVCVINNVNIADYSSWSQSNQNGQCFF